MSKYPGALVDSACPDVQVHEQDEHQCHARVALVFVDGGDIDHTLARGDGGATHASNLKCLCRFHHLLKTFWGWRDRQLRNGRAICTARSWEPSIVIMNARDLR